MVYTQPSICPREWHAQIHMGLWHTNGSLNLSQKTRPYNNQQKKREPEKLWICCPSLPQNKIERKWKKEWVPRPAEELKKNYGKLR